MLNPHSCLLQSFIISFHLREECWICDFVHFCTPHNCQEGLRATETLITDVKKKTLDVEHITACIKHNTAILNYNAIAGNSNAIPLPPLPYID